LNKQGKFEGCSFDLFVPFIKKDIQFFWKNARAIKHRLFCPPSKFPIQMSNENIIFAFAFQEDFWSTALKTLITVSTIILLGLIVAYHALEVQVSK
jgi:hypothetical protein